MHAPSKQGAQASRLCRRRLTAHASEEVTTKDENVEQTHSAIFKRNYGGQCPPYMVAFYVFTENRKPKTASGQRLMPALP